MALESDLIVDRRRLKQRLALWRVVALVALLACGVLAVSERGNPLPHDHVARLSIAGIITQDRKLVDDVTALAGDASVRALILAVDSPGGSVAGGESLHDAIARVAARKPVVAVMGGTAASAAYMISVPAARIFASEATLTGSIGVLLQTAEVSGLLDKLGISADALVSGPLKDQPSFTKPLSPEGRTVLQGIVADLYDQFVGIVASGRHMPADKVRALADGRAYTGRQALGLGLIDAIGGEPEARAWLAATKGVPQSIPIEDIETRSFVERTFGATLGGLLGSTAKNLWGQGLALDGAWAIWHP